MKPLEVGTYEDITDRCITKETTTKFRYQVSADGSKHIANITDTSQKIRFVKTKKFLYINKPKTEKLFGAIGFTPDKSKTLVITEGELDAMSVYQTTGMPAVSITHGTSSAGKCIQHNLDYISRFNGVIVAFDDDKAGREASTTVTSILSVAKVKSTTVEYPKGLNDSNEALMKGLDIELAEAFERAKARLVNKKVKSPIYFISKTGRYHVQNTRGEQCTLDALRIRCHVNLLHPDMDKDGVTQYINMLTSVDSDSFCEDITIQPYKPHGRITLNNVPLLNASNYKVASPVKGHPEIILKLFREMLGDEQLPYFISWLSYFFKGCESYNLEQSSALYLAGDQGAGKGLFHDVILKELVGQGADGGMLFTSGFTGKIYEHPFVTFPDTFSELSERERTKFTGLIKNIVANGNRMVNHKYGAQENIEWKGRVIVSLNMDEKSSEALPDVHKQDSEKFMMLRVTKGSTVTDYSPEEWTQIIKSEMGSLSYYLLNYKIPTELQHPRFGVKSYHHKELIAEIRAQNRNVAVAALIQQHLKDNSFNSIDVTASELLMILGDIEDSKPSRLRVMNENIKIHSFSRKLVELSNTYGWMSKKIKGGRNIYEIERTNENLYS